MQLHFKKIIILLIFFVNMTKNTIKLLVVPFMLLFTLVSCGTKEEAPVADQNVAPIEDVAPTPTEEVAPTADQAAPEVAPTEEVVAPTTDEAAPEVAPTEAAPTIDEAAPTEEVR